MLVRQLERTCSTQCFLMLQRFLQFHAELENCNWDSGQRTRDVLLHNYAEKNGFTQSEFSLRRQNENVKCNLREIAELANLASQVGNPGAA